MKTILVPLDGSACAEQVLPYVRLLAPLLNARIHLLRVLPETEPATMFAESFAVMAGAFPVGSSAITHLSTQPVEGQQAAEYLTDQADALRDIGVPFDIDVRVGMPADVIVDVAESERVDIIAMATHGYSGLRRWAVGSVTDKVIHATRRPLLLVRGTAHPPYRRLRNVMVPLDGSRLALQAIPWASELARRSEANVTLLQAVMPTMDLYPETRMTAAALPAFPELVESMQAQASKSLEHTAEPLRHKRLRVATAVATGFPAESIVDEAQRRQIDLIVMATHGYSGLRRWAVGSVTDKVIQTSNIPLLLIRSSDESHN